MHQLDVSYCHQQSMVNCASVCGESSEWRLVCCKDCCTTLNALDGLLGANRMVGDKAGLTVCMHCCTCDDINIVVIFGFPSARYA